MKQFFFLAGFPRSGSTLLANILNQNPLIYCSANSPLIELLYHSINFFKDSEQTINNPIKTIEKNVIQGYFNNIYKDTHKPIIIDKSRGWVHPDNIKMLKYATIMKPKVLTPVRDIPSILASFEILARKSNSTMLPKTTKERCEIFMKEDTGLVINSIKNLKEGLENNPSHIHLIEYDDLVSKPKHVMDNIYKFLELEPYKHNLEHVENVIPEGDVLGLKDVHIIKNKIERPTHKPEDIIGKELVEKYSGLEFWRSFNKNPIIEKSKIISWF